jgi:putative zinc finger/helix-turn-helix YgiT family protein
MKCAECHAEMTSRRENYKYDASGLPNVTLLGVEVRICPDCGEREVVIPKIEELHRAIARAVIGKAARLVPEEVRFLRKVLGLSGADFAKRMGVDPTTVSRWETGTQPIGPQADRLLRLMVVVSPPKSDYAVETLADIEDDAKPLRLRLEPTRAGWREAAA